MSNVTDGQALVGRLDGLKKSFAEITGDAGGFLRCETCRDVRPVRARYWRDGWPKCCGYTMRWWTARQVRDGEVPD